MVNNNEGRRAPKGLRYTIKQLIRMRILFLAYGSDQETCAWPTGGQGMRFDFLSGSSQQTQDTSAPR